jgi:hypothetical protein
VSKGGGTGPLWARNGRELFYDVEPGTVMAVPVEAGATFRAGAPQMVVDGPYGYSGLLPQWPYDVSPDGRRFVMIKEGGGQERTSAAVQIIVVQNWLEELRRRVPVN